MTPADEAVGVTAAENNCIDNWHLTDQEAKGPQAAVKELSRRESGSTRVPYGTLFHGPLLSRSMWFISSDTFCPCWSSGHGKPTGPKISVKNPKGHLKEILTNICCGWSSTWTIGAVVRTTWVWALWSVLILAAVRWRDFPYLFTTLLLLEVIR